MQKDLNISFLNDIYGQLLTKRQREVIAQYYDYDLSLQEISDNIGISRQAFLDAIKKGWSARARSAFAGVCSGFFRRCQPKSGPGR